jgi:hypothetical protein
MGGSPPAGDSSMWGLSPRQAAMLAGIVIATIAIYIPSLRNSWVFDDWKEFVENKTIHSWPFIWNAFRYDSWWFLNPDHLPQSAYYRPIENLWFAANDFFFGKNPALWHLAKILLHAMVVVLVFRLAQLLTGDAATGLLTAAIFAVMPAHVGGVVWASAIPEPLSTAFELGAMVCLIERGPGWSRGLFGAVILFACAMLTHESAILFPLIVAVYVFLFEEDGQVSDSETQAVRTRRRIVSALRTCAPFAAVVFAYMCARLNALGFNLLFGIHYNAGASMVMPGVEVSRPHYGPLAIFMTLPVALITYVAVLALPAMSGPTHAVQWITHPEPTVFISATALVILGAAGFALAWRSPNRRIYLFCAAWGFLTIAPALNLNALWWLVDDRYLYAPSFGWSLAFALAVVEIAATGSRARRTVGAAMTVLLALYALSAMQTERYWHDDVAFFGRCVEIGPTVADYRWRLAAAQNKAHDVQGAARTLEQGTILDPDDAHLHLKLAQQYQMMGRQLDFQREFQKFNELSAAIRQQQRAAKSSGAP